MIYNIRWQKYLSTAVDGDGRNQEEIAVEIGISIEKFLHYLAGYIPDGVDLVRKIAKVLKQNPDDWEMESRICIMDVYIRGNFGLNNEECQMVLADIEEIARVSKTIETSRNTLE